MRRRELLKAGAALSVLGLPSVGRAASRLRRSPPNILLVVTDQERHWRDLPAAVDLPGHARLLERGRGFLEYHVNTTPCSPSRSTMYCGQHTQHTGMISNHGAPPFPEMAPVKTIGHMLREHGYHTAYKGKWHLSKVPDGANLGYGPYPSTRNALEPFGFAEYNDDGDPHGITWTGFKYDPQTASNAARWLHRQGRDLRGRQPWFLAVNFTNPHDVMYFDDTDGAQERSRLVPDYLSPLSSPPQEGVYKKEWDLPLPASYYKDDLSSKPWSQQSYVEFCDMVYGRMAPDDERRWRRYQSYYFNCLRDADRHLVTVLDALDGSGLAGDTVVVFTADHGEMAGAHRLRQKGPHMYKENVRVPLIVRHPDVTSGGTTTNALGSAMDLVPTMLAFAGVTDVASRYPDLKGVDLSPSVANPAARTDRDRRGVLFNYTTPLYIDPAYARAVLESGGGDWFGLLKAALKTGRPGPRLDHPGLFRGVHDGRYKFARYFKPAEHHVPTDWETLLAHNELELYDLQDDPDEIVNLAASPAAHRELLLRLNAQTNALVALEVGEDLGDEQFGPGFRYRL